MKSAAKVAHEVSNFVREIRKKHMGKGPEEVVTRFCGPWVICEMKGNLTNVEKFMAQTPEGRRMIHEARTELVKTIYEDNAVSEALNDIVGAHFQTLYTDFNVELDTAMSIFVFDRPLGLDSST